MADLLVGAPNFSVSAPSAGAVYLVCGDELADVRSGLDAASFQWMGESAFDCAGGVLSGLGHFGSTTWGSFAVGDAGDDGAATNAGRQPCGSPRVESSAKWVGTRRQDQPGGNAFSSA